MSADRISPPVPETTSPSAVAGRAAGWIAAVILFSGFAAYAYWLAGGSWVAGSDFEPLLPPLLAAAQAVTLTLGAAALLRCCSRVSGSSRCACRAGCCA